MCPKGESLSSVGGFRPALATAVVVTLTGGLVASATSPASAAAPCATNTYTRQFFANTGFSGTPKRTDCDTAVSENWGTKLARRLRRRQGQLRCPMEHETRLRLRRPLHLHRLRPGRHPRLPRRHTQDRPVEERHHHRHQDRQPHHPQGNPHPRHAKPSSDAGDPADDRRHRSERSGHSPMFREVVERGPSSARTSPSAPRFPMFAPTSRSWRASGPQLSRRSRRRTARRGSRSSPAAGQVAGRGRRRAVVARQSYGDPAVGRPAVGDRAGQLA